jgi:TonB family protein
MRGLKIAWMLACLLLCHAFASAQAEAEANDRTRVDEDPIPLNLPEVKAKIGYPALAKATFTQGKVVVRLLIDENGNYVKHQLVQDPTTMLSSAVEAQIAALKFKPARFNGRRIACWVRIPFDFQLVPQSGAPFSTAGVFYSLDSALAHRDLVTHLFLNHQGLTQFPTKILGFPNLQVLDLGDNALTVIPDVVILLPFLSYLGLSHNQITTVPEAVWEMPSLQALNLKGNPIPKPEQKRLEREHRAVLEPVVGGRVQF